MDCMGYGKTFPTAAVCVADEEVRGKKEWPYFAGSSGTWRSKASLSVGVKYSSSSKIEQEEGCESMVRERRAAVGLVSSWVRVRDSSRGAKPDGGVTRGFAGWRRPRRAY